MIKNGVIATPRLAGSILPGITRKSVLTLANQIFGLIPEERDIRYDELFVADELFCTGTAAVITPILSVAYSGESHRIGNGKPGKLTKKLYDELKGIQLGQRQDKFSWLYFID